VLPLGLLLFAGGLTAVVLAAALLLLPLLSADRTVTLIVDGATHTIQTDAVTVGALLNERAIALNDGDIVAPALNHRLTQDLVVRITRARSVTLTVDGQTQVFRTSQTNPAAILDSAGLSAGPNDVIIIDGTRTQAAQLPNWPVPVSQIVLRRTLPVRVLDDAQEYRLETTSLTVGEALFDAGITLYLADVVSPDLQTPITPNLTITIQRARPLSIIADGAVIETRVRGLTVADALAEAGLALVGEDYTIPAETEPLLPGLRIRVIRVRKDILTEEAEEPFQTIFQADPALELDQQAVIQTGQNRKIQTTIHVRYENGIEVGRETGETQVVQEGRDQVIAYGTNVVLRTVDTPEGPRQYWRRIRMYATSYHPAALGGDNITATGETLRKGIVASSPALIRYGSEVYVPGYGIGRMADTGPAYRPLWIDLGYDDSNFVPWSRWVDVYLLVPVPDTIQYRLPRP
jgi:uncharacterized protein YabE (DUF348 family)